MSQYTGNKPFGYLGNNIGSSSTGTHAPYAEHIVRPSMTTDYPGRSLPLRPRLPWPLADNPWPPIAAPKPVRVPMPIYIMGKVEPTNTSSSFSGIDACVKINDTTLGSAQAISFEYDPNTSTLTGKLIVLIMMEGVTELADRLNNSTIEVIGANEYGNQMNLIKTGIMEVDKIVSGVSVDDMIIEAFVHFTIHY